MDDIIDKLKLLDYEASFQMKPISRIFFSHYEEEKGFDKWEYLYELCHWLMSFSQSKGKKNGIYPSFQKHKTSQEAVKRLIADCKKFGIKSSRFYDEQEMMQGYGESVWYLINDLLNRELIRRDYKFEEPIINDDSDDGNDNLEEDKEDNNIIQANFNMSENSKSMNGKSIAKNNQMVVENGMITQTNFGLNMNEKLLNPNINAENNFDDFNESMINCNIDPNDWSKEWKRVEKDLMKFYASYDKIETNALNECLDQARKTETTLSDNLTRGFNTVIDKISSDIYRISKEEARLQHSNISDFSVKLNDFSAKNTQNFDELWVLRDNMKTKIEYYDTLSIKTQKINEEYEAKRKNIDSTDKVEKWKKSLKDLKLEVFKLDQRMGIIQTILPYKEEQMRKLHHLYDNIEFSDDEFEQ